jgi:hypothetical protein
MPTASERPGRMTIPVEAAYLRAERVEKLAAGQAAADARPRFGMDLYTGAEMMGWNGRFVVDVAGIELGTQKLCALREHMRDRVCGASEKIEKDGKSVRAEGWLSQATADGKEIAALLDEGAPLQASMFIPPTVIESVAEGASVKVNGATFAGPGEVWRKCKLLELSFVSVGRDGNTAAFKLAADDPRANTRLDGLRAQGGHLLGVSRLQLPRRERLELPGFLVCHASCLLS